MSEFTRIRWSRRAGLISVSIAILICCVYYLLTTVKKPSVRIQTLAEDGKLAPSKTQGDTEFEFIAAGQGDLDGIDASFQSYRSSDGVGVLFLTQVLSSAESARLEFEKRGQSAIRIIERGDKVDREGNIIGERAVLPFFDRAKTDKEMVAVLWTRKIDLLVIETQSMEHALAFEQKYCR
jgi:hypothetical protein